MIFRVEGVSDDQSEHIEKFQCFAAMDGYLEILCTNCLVRKCKAHTIAAVIPAVESVAVKTTNTGECFRTVAKPLQIRSSLHRKVVVVCVVENATTIKCDGNTGTGIAESVYEEELFSSSARGHHLIHRGEANQSMLAHDVYDANSAPCAPPTRCR